MSLSNQNVQSQANTDIKMLEDKAGVYYGETKFSWTDTATRWVFGCFMCGCVPPMMIEGCGAAALIGCFFPCYTCCCWTPFELVTQERVNYATKRRADINARLANAQPNQCPECICCTDSTKFSWLHISTRWMFCCLGCGCVPPMMVEGCGETACISCFFPCYSVCCWEVDSLMVGADNNVPKAAMGSEAGQGALYNQAYVGYQGGNYGKFDWTSTCTRWLFCCIFCGCVPPVMIEGCGPAALIATCFPCYTVCCWEPFHFELKNLGANARGDDVEAPSQ